MAALPRPGEERASVPEAREAEMVVPKVSGAPVALVSQPREPRERVKAVVPARVEERASVPEAREAETVVPSVWGAPVARTAEAALVEAPAKFRVTDPERQRRVAYHTHHRNRYRA